MYKGGIPATMLAMTSVTFSGPRALADSVRQPTMTRHQLIVKTIDCMRKRMSIDRAVSYNEAAKTCRDQMSKQSAISTPGRTRHANELSG
jgi:hypothetical protein